MGIRKKAIPNGNLLQTPPKQVGHNRVNALWLAFGEGLVRIGHSTQPPNEEIPMKLYFSPGACSLAPHIVLNEMNQAFEFEAVDLKNKTCASGDFTKINSKGAVPTLKMENGEYLTEGAVIMQYLADQKPELGLLPKFGTLERYRALEWMNYIATEVHRGFSPLWGAEKVMNATFTNPTTENIDNFKKFHMDNMGKKFDYINAKLANNDYFMGKNFTIVDAYMFTVVGWTKYLNMDISKWSNISAFMDRVYKRPAVQKAMKNEGILK